MRSGNDANNTNVAQDNCLYCAVGGLIGQPASLIMQMVYNMLQEPMPSGSDADNTGADGFGKLYWKCKEKKDYIEGVNSKPLEYQIAGLTYFLQMKGCTVSSFGTAAEPKTFEEVLEYANGRPESTRFLALAGDADFGTFVTSLAHWTVGQVQNGVATFYDHQLNITNEVVAQALKPKIQGVGDATVGETRKAHEPMGPFGQKLDDDDKRSILLEVAK
jgi:hypothetical protein